MVYMLKRLWALRIHRGLTGVAGLLCVGLRTKLYALIPKP